MIPAQSEDERLQELRNESDQLLYEIEWRLGILTWGLTELLETEARLEDRDPAEFSVSLNKWQELEISYGSWNSDEARDRYNRGD